MLQSPTSTPLARGARALKVALAIGAMLAVAAAPAGASQTGRTPVISKTVVKKAENATLQETVLTSLKNRTLYTLSAELHGRFICTGGCLATWHPIVIARNVHPLGPTRLGKVKRPDGRFQVTYKGRPLYTFGGDARAGDANGEGIKDVGTWHAASLGKISPHPEPQPQPPTNPYPYPY